MASDLFTIRIFAPDGNPEGVRQRAAEEMQRSAEDQYRRDELPRVSVGNSIFAECQIIAYDTGCGGLENELNNKGSNVNADQRQQDDAPAFLPRPRK